MNLFVMVPLLLVVGEMPALKLTPWRRSWASAPPKANMQRWLDFYWKRREKFPLREP